MVTDNELDKIYDIMDTMINAKMWTALNSLFSSLLVIMPTMDMEILLAYATTSLCVKSKIKTREAFIIACKERYPDTGLWDGL